MQVECDSKHCKKGICPTYDECEHKGKMDDKTANNPMVKELLLEKKTLEERIAKLDALNAGNNKQNTFDKHKLEVGAK